MFVSILFLVCFFLGGGFLKLAFPCPFLTSNYYFPCLLQALLVSLVLILVHCYQRFVLYFVSLVPLIKHFFVNNLILVGLCGIRICSRFVRNITGWSLYCFEVWWRD